MPSILYSPIYAKTYSVCHPISAQIESFFEGELVRNPANKNSGKFVTLTEFLELAKTRTVPGVLISIKVNVFLIPIFRVKNKYSKTCRSLRMRHT